MQDLTACCHLPAYLSLVRYSQVCRMTITTLMNLYLRQLVCLLFFVVLVGCSKYRYQPADWAERKAKLTEGTLPSSTDDNPGLTGLPKPITPRPGSVPTRGNGGSLPRLGQGSLPHTGQGSLPYAGQGSLPLSSGGSLPIYSGRGSLPR